MTECYDIELSNGIELSTRRLVDELSTPGFLADVLTCAIEDFCHNGWRQIETGTYRFDPPESAAAVVIEIGDGRPEELARHTINLDTMVAGIARAAFDPDFALNSGLRRDILQAFAMQDAGYLDVESADVILQAAIFGELRYS